MTQGVRTLCEVTGTHSKYHLDALARFVENAYANGSRSRRAFQDAGRAGFRTAQDGGFICPEREAVTNGTGLMQELRLDSLRDGSPHRFLLEALGHPGEMLRTVCPVSTGYGELRLTQRP